MVMRTFRIFLCVILLGAACVACKDKELDVKLVMEGQPKVEIDDFVEVGSQWTLKASGIESPEEGVRYYWNISGSELNDTTDVFTVTMPSEPGTFDIKCTAFAEGYYDRGITRSVILVDPAFNASLNIGDVNSASLFCDPRDSKVYRYVTVGELDWFIVNLATSISGIPYLEADVMFDVFGGYYTFEEACTACPQGWRLPTDKEWIDMASRYSPSKAGSEIDSSSPVDGAAPKIMSAALFNGVKMWEYDPQCEPVNTSLLSAIPAGYCANKVFTGLNEIAVFWTADTYGGKGVYRYIRFDDPDLKVNYADPVSLRASVRCVREAQ